MSFDGVSVFLILIFAAVFAAGQGLFGLEAGHPVPVAIALVGKEMADPIGSEFGMTADEIAYGATLSQAIERMSDRCRHADVDLFAATVRLQERAGGNLTNLLKLNASTV